MDQFSDIEERAPPNYIQDNLKITSNNGDDDEPKKKVMKLVSQIDIGNNDMPVETMVLGSTTVTEQFVQLPPELLTLVMAKLEKRSDLLICRQVNSTWRILSSLILRQQPLLQIGFDNRGGHTKRFKITDMIRLNVCLKNSKRLFKSLDSFPCARFQFFDVSLEKQSLQDFFNLYGPFILSLGLSHFLTCIEDGQMKSVNRLLTRQVPNVKVLKLSQMITKLKGKGRSPAILFDNSQTKLPHLETLVHGKLSYEDEKTVVVEIITAAPNLKLYFLAGLPSPAMMGLLVSQGKGHALKSIVMDICPENIDQYEKCVDFLPTLVSLKVGVRTRNDNELFVRAAAVISKILQSNKNSLTFIDLFYPLGRVPRIEFPVLDKVTTLGVAGSPLDSNRIMLPPGLNFTTTTFPNLRNVNFGHLFPTTADFWDSLFPFDLNKINWPIVHTLTINCEFQNFIHNLSRLFPNLKNLVVIFDRHGGENFPLVCHGIFEHMKGLETLKFFGVDFSTGGNEFPALDSVLTGFSPATCRRLAESEEMLEDGEVEKLRENLSILELTGLRELNLKIYFWPRDTMSSSPWTRVSEIWAFQRMPHLQVNWTLGKDKVELRNTPIYPIVDTD